MNFKKQILPMALAFTMVMPMYAIADTKTEVKTEKTVVASEKPAVTNETLSRENLMGTLWYQSSVEAKALYYQGYNVAKTVLDAKIKEKSDKTYAIALDIDETVLDNSPQQAYFAYAMKMYPEGWKEWVDEAKADPVAGAKEFLNYAKSKGVEVFYISDRKTDQLKATIKNLEDKGLPCADEKHVLLKSKDDKSKEARRQKVAKEYNLIMLFGDNIVDFEEFEGLTLEQRDEKLKGIADKFGEKYIIFPNPMYGSWESAIYNHDFKKSPQEKEDLRLNTLKVFDYQKDVKKDVKKDMNNKETKEVK
ncbi:MAG: 5'-nucleotidase, lipoprotein e(P4) family [Peptoanaerobacter stomatis]